MHLSRRHSMINILVHARSEMSSWLFCSREFGPVYLGASVIKCRPADPFYFRPSLNGPNFIQLRGPGDPLTFPRHQNIYCRVASTAMRHRLQGPTRQRHAPTRCSCSAACFSHRRHPLARCWRNLIASSAHLKPYYHLRQRGGSRPWRRRRRR
jgi:hypothetical protein